MTTKLRNLRLSWPAILLFTALLAQAPHAAAVFIRIAPHDAQWEVWTSFVGAWVYAIALEGATAYFVWRSKLRWAIAFAVFSIAHNVAYYLPGAWTFDVYGATLTVRYVFSAVLISMSLPIAIAAFSHVQAEDRKRMNTYPTPPATPTALPSAILGHSSDTMTEATLEEERSVHSVEGTTGAPVSDIRQGARPESQDSDAKTAQTTPPTPARKVRKARRKTTQPSPAQRRAQIISSGMDDAAAIAAAFHVSVRTAQMDLEQIRKMSTQANGVHA